MGRVEWRARVRASHWERAKSSYGSVGMRRLSSLRCWLSFTYIIQSREQLISDPLQPRMYFSHRNDPDDSGRDNERGWLRIQQGTRVDSNPLLISKSRPRSAWFHTLRSSPV
ncbi:hypothetical protein XA68_16799 [Ophiocordyceps unilateralis]|uniref:Uncharacterized protein n=1 Tax=Ophiocordyceps unilateralis TaxID=268505 RepID=A0A2A9PK71_OPHUN|nr:hypothetical protein XA68_16799 [Ophiocordyceps unilateralis]